MQPPENSLAALQHPRRLWRSLLRRESWLVAIFGLLIGVAILAATFYFLDRDRMAAVESEKQRAALLASMYEAHLSQTLSNIDNTLLLASGPRSMSGSAPDRFTKPKDRGYNPVFTELLLASPHLRSISLLDRAGKVLQSSNPQNLGLRIRWSELGIARDIGPHLEAGAASFVRDLHELQTLPLSAKNERGLYAVPMARAVSSLPGANILVVLVNPAFLLPENKAFLDADTGMALLMDYQGSVLASRGASPYGPGAIVTETTAVQMLSQEKEFGSYVWQSRNGRAAHGSVQLVSFRSARNMPLAVLVSLSEDRVIAEWSASSGQIRWIGLAGALAVTMAAVLLARLLRQRETMRDSLRAARDAAVKASAAKSAFLANMSHEIRTPINSMVGMTELVLSTPLSRQQHEYLTLAQTSSQVLLRVIDDILDFSRVESGKLELLHKDFDLHRLCQQAMKNLSLQAETKGLEWILDIAAEVPRLARGDSLRLGQILLHLLTNAIKFTPRGTVRLEVLQSTRSPGQSLVQIAVHDTGIGISAEKQKEIFDVFSQADNSSTRRYGGSGLGLAISQRLVSLMGGNLQVQSEAGRGAVFSFDCLLEVPAESQTTPHPVDFAGPQPSIYVADANPLSRQILIKLMKAWELEPSCLGNAAELQTMLSAGPAQGPAVLLLDSRLLDLDLQQHLHRLAAAQDVWLQVILMHSVTEGLGGPSSGNAAKPWHKLVKPVTPSDLHEALVRALHGPDQQRTVEATLQSMPRPSPQTDASAPAFRVLLVEDTPMNQKLAMGVLSRLGVETTLAVNGLEGVQKRQTGLFDLVIMDLQMPVMDGLQATKEIRAWEALTGTDAVPIVAMTAHGMAQDRQDCLEAGMNDFLTKPVALNEFSRVISECVQNRKSAGTSPMSLAAHPLQAIVSSDNPDKSTMSSTPTYLDHERAMAFFGDEARLREMLQLLKDTLENDIPQIRQKLEEGDSEGVNRLLHPIKGFIPIFCNDAMVDHVTQVEILSKSQPIEEIRAAFEKLGPALGFLVSEIQAYMATPA